MSVPELPAPAPAPLPDSTYRLQLHAGFPFASARRTLPYLARLGVSTVYLSPIWASTPGSTHGYDVTDHARINPDLGGLEGLRRFSARARELGLSVIVDFVPNHMGIQGGHNPYWEDVLCHGQASRYAHFFDISWQPLKRALAGKVLLPTLGDQYGRVLERGELSLGWDAGAREGGRFFLGYWERRFPLSPRSVAALLAELGESLPRALAGEALAELASITRSVANLPRSQDPDLTDTDRLSRAQEMAVASRRFGALLRAHPGILAGLGALLGEINADPARLDAYVSEQNYRLAWWKVAAEEINYRRFFDINDLAALRMEDPRVFAWAHTLLFELLREGLIHGVRLDHTDGLYDPAGYFRALQAGAAHALGAAPEEGELPLYVVAEKILEPGETLPPDWAIHGTTGYDFLAELGGVFVDAAHEDELSGIYRRFTGDRDNYLAHLYRGKQLIQRVSLPGEVNVLAEHLERLAEADLRSRDFTLSAIRSAIREVIACFPVYRTYVRLGGSREPGDHAKIRQAVRGAKRHNREAGQPVDAGVFDFLESVLLLNVGEEATQAAWADFVLKFQQLTGPVTAKGAEDTAFYRYVRLLSLNEVGGDPARFGTSPRAFHAAAARRAEDWPRAMLAGSTHDTKRGEDTRARISVLSELPQVWSEFLRTHTPLFASLSEEHDLGPAPSALDTYALLQNALGAYPLRGGLKEFPDRLAAYLLKASREAKLRTSWAAPDEAYEAALDAFTRQLLADAGFLASLRGLHARISPYGAQSGLSAALVRLTAPGVPDTYQGAEGWNQSLVDPDNRRPVDYAWRGRMLTRLEQDHSLALARRWLGGYEDGAVKLLVTWAALQARRASPDLFTQGSYRPIEAGKYLLAFAREHGGQVAVTVAPRLTLSLTREKTPWALAEAWGNRTLTLPGTGTYTNVLTGEKLRVRTAKLPVAKVLEDFPLALLVRG
ncbi:maltooligosyl trehalose synthase [Deinococcus reticulitermitis]|uniref:Maltooligosyl trehalose synthase n=1 Tax=Deinococcus reticulitermitis TaxID=856736 RepID=A0A1H7CFT1_9DEIO|nr:malto-oligosyltrehalose synthase [Deinococcus reticulitermitis]SEJ88114.1 maltooligosyl trehalose synthase [Deinococcus reticulitermitis]